jgi:hypothetical protein
MLRSAFDERPTSTSLLSLNINDYIDACAGEFDLARDCQILSFLLKVWPQPRTMAIMFFFFGEAHIGHRAVALVYQLCKWFFVVLMQNTLHFNRVLAAQLNLQECGDVILTAALQNPNITVLSMRNVNMGKR